MLRGEGGEGAERGVCVEPERVAFAESGDRSEVVEVHRVDGAGVGDDDGRAGGVGEGAVQGGGIDGLAAGEGGDGDEGAAAEAEDGQGLRDGGVRGSGQDAHRAEGCRAVLGGRDAEAFAEPLAGDGEAGGVGHGGAADEGPGVRGGEAEELAEPGGGFAFEVLAGAVQGGVGVLVVDGGQPVPDEGGGGGAAGDESEVAGAGGGGEARHPALRELVEGGFRAGGVDGEGRLRLRRGQGYVGYERYDGTGVQGF